MGISFRLCLLAISLGFFSCKPSTITNETSEITRDTTLIDSYTGEYRVDEMIGDSLLIVAHYIEGVKFGIYEEYNMPEKTLKIKGYYYANGKALGWFYYDHGDLREVRSYLPVNDMKANEAVVQGEGDSYLNINEVYDQNGKLIPEKSRMFEVGIDAGDREDMFETNEETKLYIKYPYPKHDSVSLWLGKLGPNNRFHGNPRDDDRFMEYRFESGGGENDSVIISIIPTDTGMVEFEAFIEDYDPTDRSRKQIRTFLSQEFEVKR